MGRREAERQGGGQISAKHFTAMVLSAVMLLMLLFGTAVCVVDPYMRLHPPLENLKPVINSSWADIRHDEIYKNPGIAQYFDYDAVILGSSVTENYRASWFSKAFDCRAVKLSYSNAQSKNFDIILGKIYKAKGRGVKKVFLALDTTILGKSAEETSYELPDMIYDSKLSNVCQYIWNKEVYCETGKNLWLNATGQVPKVDDAYRWDGQHEYSKKNALQNSPRRPFVETMMEPYGSIENCKANLKNITKHIEAHPETEFNIIFSPYSMLYWDLVIRDGEYQQVMFNTQIAIEKLLPYKNVRIFYFQNDTKVIRNLDNYMDFLHFSADINRYIVDCMAKGEHELTEENYMWHLEQMRQIVTTYDFDAIYQ